MPPEYLFPLQGNILVHILHSVFGNPSPGEVSHCWRMLWKHPNHLKAASSYCSHEGRYIRTSVSARSNAELCIRPGGPWNMNIFSFTTTGHSANWGGGWRISSISSMENGCIKDWITRLLMQSTMEHFLSRRWNNGWLDFRMISNQLSRQRA